MKFELSEILAGIPTWFIARQHRFTTNYHWLTGVLFADGTERKHLGLVQTLQDNKTNSKYLQLKVRGPMPHSFFDLLKEGIELTLRRYPGLQITRLVPCPGPEGKHCVYEFDLTDLVRRLERKKPKKYLECPKCEEDIYIPQLLFGLHQTTEDELLRHLEELRDQMQEGFAELRELSQRDFLRQFRREQKLLESYCPNVFVLRPDHRNVWLRDIDQDRVNLQLYCQAPGEWHPTEEGGLYPIDAPKQWLQTIAPHVRRMVKVLKYANPLVSPVLGVKVPALADDVKADVALMNALVTKLPEIVDGGDHRWQRAEEDDLERERLSGSALRRLRQFLDQKDPQQHWGGLKRVLTPEGDYLWLCEKHARHYDPMGDWPQHP